MRLRIVTPSESRLDAEVVRIVAEGANGAFGLLPRHVDFVSALVPGILTYQAEDAPERYAALNGGTLVKCGDEVLVAARSAILGEDLAALETRVQEEFLEIDEEERLARSAMARLEAGMIRRFVELRQEG
ncbi:MAG: F0F1 ATP synthase subunit epsilon [Pseudomonadota bacterium]